MENLSAPKVTVLMPVYNAEVYLEEAIESILDQTYRDFEFLIINDGSTDESKKIIESYTDRRIRLENNKKNRGLNYSLNKGIDLARGKYIARMDADDVSLPDRLQVQVEFMDKNPDIGVCGSWFKFTDTEEVDQKLTDPESIKAALFFTCQLGHPTVIIRKAFLDKYNLRYDTQISAEDYELWVRCARYFKIANIPKVLVLYRQHEMQKTKYETLKLINDAKKILYSQLSYIGILPSEEELDLLFLMQGTNCHFDLNEIRLLSNFLHRIIEKNKNIGFYAEPYFSSRIGRLWAKLLRYNSQFRLAPLFISSPLRKYVPWSNYHKAKFLVKCIMDYKHFQKPSDRFLSP